MQMISTRVFRAHPLWLCASTATPRPRRTSMRAAAPESADKIDIDASQQLEAVEKPVGHPSINPVTGNPQTGKLIDLYFEVFSILVVVALSFWSLYNVKDVIDQTDSADALRQPAAKTEWLALDNKDVRPLPSPHQGHYCSILSSASTKTIAVQAPVGFCSVFGPRCTPGLVLIVRCRFETGCPGCQLVISRTALGERCLASSWCISVLLCPGVDMYAA